MNPATRPDFLPTTRAELDLLGWPVLDVILVTGDTYIDAPHIGAAVIGRVLLAAGFRVGIIAQPDVESSRDIVRLGEPELFWGVTSGNVDSMVANFTASGKRRRSDDMTPGGINNRRPDRAVLVYSHLIRRHFKQTRPIVLGGIEASLRRLSHYDAWTDRIRRSILFDAKADLLLYGMADRTVVALAHKLRNQEQVHSLRGLCYIDRDPPPPEPEWGQDVMLPSHEEAASDKQVFAAMFSRFYAHSDPHAARRLLQRQDTRYLVHNPPPLLPSAEELDAVYELPFARDVHPFYLRYGQVSALQTIQFSLTTHRGCFGECRFCAIAVHQGRQVTSRSQASLLREARAMQSHPAFKGIIADVGGPTANMYSMGCRRPSRQGPCAKKSCVFPKICKHTSVDHRPQIELLRALRAVPGMRKIFVGSGLRYDLILADHASGAAYLEELLRHHVSGQLKIAPEHVQDPLLNLMGKPGRQSLEAFMRLFDETRRRLPHACYLTYYFMAAHPGGTLEDMRVLRRYAQRSLHLIPEQVQIFTPTPATYSTLMYYTGMDPFTGREVFVEKNPARKLAQQKELTDKKKTAAKNSR